MNKKLTALVAAFLTGSLLAFPVAHAATMSGPDHQAGKTRISADCKADKADKQASASHTAHAKDICIQLAKGNCVAAARIELGQR